jgi:hypothetical protein
MKNSFEARENGGWVTSHVLPLIHIMLEMLTSSLTRYRELDIKLHSDN